MLECVAASKRIPRTHSVVVFSNDSEVYRGYKYFKEELFKKGEKSFQNLQEFLKACRTSLAPSTQF